MNRRLMDSTDNKQLKLEDCDDNDNDDDGYDDGDDDDDDDDDDDNCAGDDDANSNQLAGNKWPIRRMGRWREFALIWHPM